MSKPKTGEIKFNGLGRIAIKSKAIERAGTTETWSGKIIYIGDDFYAMVPINRPENNAGRNHFPAWLTRLFGRRRSYGY